MKAFFTALDRTKDVLECAVYSPLFVLKGINVNSLSKNKEISILLSTVFSMSMPIIEFLISNGVDVNGKDKHGHSSLFFASQHNLKDIAKLLISKGANINDKDGDGCTPRHYAADSNYKEVI